MKIAIDFDDTLVDGMTGEVKSYKALDVIKNWIKEGHECYILTGRHEPEHIMEVEQFVARHGIGPLPVVSIGSYTMRLKLNHDWDILIDDSFDIWAAYEETGDTRHLIMFVDRKYEKIPAKQASTWHEVEKLVQEIVDEDPIDL